MAIHDTRATDAEADERNLRNEQRLVQPGSAGGPAPKAVIDPEDENDDVALQRIVDHSREQKEEEPGVRLEPRLYQVEDGWMELYDGKQFYFRRTAEQMVEMLELDNIAHALANCCRYGGHTRQFYSVAEHSRIMADYVMFHMREQFPDQRDRALAALTVLHHDDAEHIIGDMPRPLKEEFPLFKEYERTIDQAVALKFGTIYPFPPWLKDMDTRILVDEREQCMSRSGHDWGCDKLDPLGIEVEFHAPWVAKQLFLRRHAHLSLIASLAHHGIPDAGC